MALQIEIVMKIKEFLQCKDAKFCVEFTTMMVSIAPNGNVFETECSVAISEKISRESFEIVFMDDFVKPYIGNHVVMDFLYFKEVVFENGKLKFETSDGFVITLS